MHTGLEAVIFVGGVSLGQPATSIPIATIVGMICGLICGALIYVFANRTSQESLYPCHINPLLINSCIALTVFLVVMTNFILLIGAGLFTRSVSSFQANACVFPYPMHPVLVLTLFIAIRCSFNNLLGADVDDSGGTGPGSYDVRGNVWHLDCCDPNGRFADQGWTIFNAILGWTNNATGTSQCIWSSQKKLINWCEVGSVLAYAFYWIAVVVALVYMKFKEVCFNASLCFIPFVRS